jgi:hypothetical protein
MTVTQAWALLSERLEQQSDLRDRLSQRALRNLKLSPNLDPDKLRLKLERVTQTLPGLFEVVTQNYKMTDLHLDCYCPKSYLGHFRLSLWIPQRSAQPHIKKYERQSRQLLQNLRIKRERDYVLGLNSRVGQYSSEQLLMLDLDRFTPEAKSELRKMGGYLFKSGRGYHFVARRVCKNQSQWVRAMARAYRNAKLKPCLDRAHHKLSLKRGYATLRITSSPAKTVRPFLVQRL